MRFVKGVLLGGVILLALVGCKKELSVNLKPDGSGTIVETVRMNQNMLKMIESFTLPGKDSLSIEELMMKKAEYSLKKLEGVEFKEIKKETKGEMVYYTVVYSFKDISKIKIKMRDWRKVPFARPAKPEKGEGKKVLFTFEFKQLPGGTAELIIKNPMGELMQLMQNKVKELIEEAEKDDEEEEDEEDEPGNDDEEEEDEKDELGYEMGLTLAKQMLKDMSFSLVLVCGDEIIKTNVTNVEGNKITLVKIDFGKILENVKQFKEFQKEAMRAFKELLDEIAGFKIELEKEIKVEFK